MADNRFNKISNCGSDQYGGISGDNAGDQTGGEYTIKDWYNKPWNVVLRYTGENAENVRKTISNVAIMAANNDKVGYDQSQRLTFFNELKKVNYDPSKITTPCETDCSASTSAVIISAGYICKNKQLQKVSPSNTTYNLRNALTSVGFKAYYSSDYTGGWEKLQPGDILLNEESHVCIFVGDAKVNGSMSAATGSLDMKQAIAKLYTSDNYSFLKQKQDEESATKSFVKALKETFLNNIKEKQKPVLSDDKIADLFKNKLKEHVLNYSKLNTEIKEKKLVRGDLLSYPNLVEAPYIEVELNNVTIGGYNNEEDLYPNHIVNLEIDKINGRINQYTINITNQVRQGEDPNFIDSLLSRTGIRNKVKIKYGDSAYGAFYKEDEAYIIDATFKEDVTNARIDYSIKAVSSIAEVQETKFNFPAIQSKPSSEIIKLLYDDKKTSRLVKDVLKGMENKQQTLAKGYIPTDDAELFIPGCDEASVEDRLKQLVSYMYDPISPESSYFLSFEDSGDDNAYFKITKVSKTETSNEAIKNCYYVDIGYPGNSFVTNFSISSDVYWPMFKKYANTIPNYNYDIDYNGNLITTAVNPLTIDDNFNTHSIKLERWWDFVSSYPISATLTIKGLMKPILLIENVYIHAQFYGKKDIAEGIYTIIGQHDSISGNGYTTTLTLLKVSN